MQQTSEGFLSEDFKFKGKIEFRNVNFFYKKDEHVIKDLSFLVNPGEHVAFVGPTGSGKTTIIRLLCRLYEPQEGQILIDDVDIKDIPIARLRNMLGVVLQDTFIFSGDVAENLKSVSYTHLTLPTNREV